MLHSLRRIPMSWRTARSTRSVLPALVVGALSVACSSSSGSTTTEARTLVTVSPTTFGQGIVCGNVPGAWKTYVATLTDVTDPARPLRLASSNPVPCGLPVAFAFVVPDHAYIAEIQGYDRSDIVPFGGPNAGTEHMVDENTKEDVAPRWTTSCGSPDPDDPGVGGAAPQPTTSRLQSNVLVRDCNPLREQLPPPDAGITIEMDSVLGSLTCGDGPGQVDRLRVVPEAPGLEQSPASCGMVVPFTPVEPGQSYAFRVEGFERGSTIVRWGARCSAVARAGVTLPASCDTLSSEGSVRIDIASLLSGAGHTCSADDVVRYRAVLVGSTLLPYDSACAVDATFGPFDTSSVQLLVDGFDAAGEVKLSAFCEAAVAPAATSTATCNVTASAQ